jgi:hypothetical protein
MARIGGSFKIVGGPVTELQVNFPGKRLTVFQILVIMFNSLRGKCFVVNASNQMEINFQMLTRPKRSAILCDHFETKCFKGFSLRARSKPFFVNVRRKFVRASVRWD